MPAKSAAASRTPFRPKKGSYFDAARFGQNLLEARRGAGLTQAQLAEQLGCHRGLLSKLERGRGTLGLPHFARAAELLGGADVLLAGTI